MSPAWNARNTPVHPDGLGVLAQHAVDGVRVHGPPCFLHLPIMAEWPEHRPFDVTRVPYGFKIGFNALRCLGMDGKRVPASAFSGDAQRVVPAILVQISDLERCNLSTSEPHLQADCENRPVAKPFQLGLIGQIQHSACLVFGKRQRRALLAVDGGTLRKRDFWPHVRGGQDA
jgi:hypothetical protein